MVTYNLVAGPEVLVAIILSLRSKTGKYSIRALILEPPEKEIMDTYFGTEEDDISVSLTGRWNTLPVPSLGGGLY